jgi:hypothetical protein
MFFLLTVGTEKKVWFLHIGNPGSRLFYGNTMSSMAKPDSSYLPYLRLLYECLIINIDTNFQKGPVYAYITIFPNNRDIQRASRRRLQDSCSRGWPKSGRDQTYPVFQSLLHVTAELDNSEEMVNLLERMGRH